MAATARTLRSKAYAKLKAHPAVDEVEGEGMDEGRFFVHLKKGFKPAEFKGCDDVHLIEHSLSVGGAAEGLRGAMASIPCTCEGCRA